MHQENRRDPSAVSVARAQKNPDRDGVDFYTLGPLSIRPGTILPMLGDTMERRRGALRPGERSSLRHLPAAALVSWAHCSCGCGVRLWVFLPLSLVWLPWLRSPRKWGYRGGTWPPRSAGWLCVVSILRAKRSPSIPVCAGLGEGLGPHACPVGALMGLVASARGCEGC